MKRKTIVHLWALLLIIPALQCLAADSDPIQLHRQLKQSISKASNVGKKTAAWQQERELLLAEIQDLELKAAWADFQLEKTEKWLSTETNNTAILEINLARAANTREQLEPFFEVLYTNLETHIKNDLPFLEKERTRRLAHIRSSLDTADASLSDKLGRLLEAIQVEVDYGYNVDVTKELVRKHNGDTTQATVFRLGRLSLFRLLENETQLEWFNKDNSTWEHLTDTVIPDIKKAMEIARKKRVSTLLYLPTKQSFKKVKAQTLPDAKGGK